MLATPDYLDVVRATTIQPCTLVVQLGFSFVALKVEEVSYYSVT